MRRKIMHSLLSTILVCLLVALPVSAQQAGSLLVKGIDAPVELFSLTDEKGELTQAFFGVSAEPLTEENTGAAQAKAFQKYAQEKKLSGQKKTPDEAGQVLYEPLDEGFYLVLSTKQPGEFAPFILKIPMTVGNKTVYNVQAEPKSEPGADPDSPSTPPVIRPVIPQTGYIQWPKYVLLTLGVLFVVAGMAETFRGREKRNG